MNPRIELPADLSSSCTLTPFPVDFEGDVSIDCKCKFQIDGHFTSPGDDYDFDMKSGLGKIPRNAATRVGALVNGAGKAYHININGKKEHKESGAQGFFGDY